MGEAGKSAGSGIIGLGIVLIIFGFIGYLYPESQSTYWGLSSATVYPYRDIGELAIIFGIIIAVIGGVVYGVAGDKSNTEIHVHQIPYQPATYNQPVQQSQPVAHANVGKKYCPSCGRSIPSDSVLCAYCGSNVGGSL
jgi:hypothetical protein